MDFLTSGFNILLIILGFGVLIFIHELGHFVAAKWAGIRTEAFAVGMGPVVLSWRKGVGLKLGSTWSEVDRRVREYLKSNNDSIDSGDELDRRKKVNSAMDALGIGETEYSLRWLPIGGFVKMLGQEDANPNYVSDDPRSYNRCPIGKRMIVVSAGVVMNLILAVAFFIWAFMVGVRFESPIVGETIPGTPAARTVASNAQRLGVTDTGLQPGDRVIAIDGNEANTFADLQIASAMSRPGRAIHLKVSRAGLPEPLEFSLMPEKDKGSGLLSIGVVPGSSTTLFSGQNANAVREQLEKAGLAQQGVEPGMRLLSANGQNVDIFQQFREVVEASKGAAISTVWTGLNADREAAGDVIHATIDATPDYQLLQYVNTPSNALQNAEEGLFGLVPLVRLESIEPGPNQKILHAGDVVLRAGSLHFPRMADFRRQVQRHAGQAIELVVLRGGEEVRVSGEVDDRGLLKVVVGYAWELPVLAQPMEVSAGKLSPDTGKSELRTPAAALNAMPGTRIHAVNGTAVNNWAELRRAVKSHTAGIDASSSAATVTLAITPPVKGALQENLELRLSPQAVAELHDLGWRTKLSAGLFEPIQFTRTAEGSPIRAVAMGFEETYKLVMLTYLTIDRLFRGSVGVEQLRGPLGIVHIGTKVADRGFMYIIFFLGMISVNLAVLNFLPLPIVDGGLFLFLVYEKLKGRPPSLAFQNAATVVGLFLIGTLFLVVTWNDVVRLLS